MILISNGNSQNKEEEQQNRNKNNKTAYCRYSLNKYDEY